MSGSFAFCPQCQADRVFIDAGGTRRCAVCGFESQVAGQGESSLATEAMSVVRVLFRVLLIMLAIVVVGVGVLFAGCALMMGGSHF